ncbi:hypothetical protein PspLS_03323 [Pyricularia sp. CBS 133598]|nr:hypothetical protein PspLS_03323 [Pyricularia sp. CBS 133598]
MISQKKWLVSSLIYCLDLFLNFFATLSNFTRLFFLFCSKAPVWKHKVGPVCVFRKLKAMI